MNFVGFLVCLNPFWPFSIFVQVPTSMLFGCFHLMMLVEKDLLSKIGTLFYYQPFCGMLRVRSDLFVAANASSNYYLFEYFGRMNGNAPMDLVTV